ncbi:MAG: alpha/beta fold hydrolase [Butyricicoccus sp.]
MDISHFYQEKGAGEPLLLLHGNGENSEYFVHQLDELSAHYRVIALDTRGHGKTPRGSVPFTIRQFAEDLASFMDAIRLEKAHILGFSDGANIAMCFAIRYPHRVNKLILNGGNLTAAGIKRRTQLPIELSYRMANAFASKSPEAKRHAELLGLMVNDPNLSPADISTISAQTLVIAGTHDMVKTRHTRLIADSIPNSTLCILSGDHFVANKQYAAFNRAVLRFLTE